MHNPLWKSKGMYEHPDKHRAGTYGTIEQSQDGIYVLVVGGSHMFCHQDWASKIKYEEQNYYNKEVKKNEAVDRD